MELYTYEISKELAATWFNGGIDEKGIPKVKLSTMQAWGKKTVTGVHVTLVNVEQCNGYAMEHSIPYQIPCVRIKLEKPMPQSRKNFDTVVKDRCRQWLLSTDSGGLSTAHPYRKAIEHFIGLATG